MNKTQEIKAEDVPVGAVVHAHGYRWTVERNEYDAHGNTGSQPRHVLHCHSADGLAPEGYAEHMSLGALIGTTVRVEVADVAEVVK